MNPEDFKPLIEQAKKENVHRDELKTQILFLMSRMPRYTLRGAAGEKLRTKEMGEVFQIIDHCYNDLEAA